MSVAEGRTESNESTHEDRTTFCFCLFVCVRTGGFQWCRVDEGGVLEFLTRSTVSAVFESRASLSPFAALAPALGSGVVPKLSSGVALPTPPPDPGFDEYGVVWHVVTGGGELSSAFKGVVVAAMLFSGRDTVTEMNALSSFEIDGSHCSKKTRGLLVAQLATTYILTPSPDP